MSDLPKTREVKSSGGAQGGAPAESRRCPKTRPTDDQNARWRKGGAAERSKSTIALTASQKRANLREIGIFGFRHRPASSGSARRRQAVWVEATR